MSRNLTPRYLADRNNRSAGIQRRLDMTNILEKKFIDCREKILMIENDIRIVGNLIREDTMELKKVHQTISEFKFMRPPNWCPDIDEFITERELMQKSEMIMYGIIKMRNIKQNLLCHLEEKKKELASMEKYLWIHKMQNTPQAWTRSHENIEEETTEHEVKKKKKSRRTRLQRILSWFCCSSKN
ncbi:uncharacterized protein ACNLHF_006507 [Anomaloglossus baeobatrachus]